MRRLAVQFEEELPALDPFIVREDTERGWLGVTAKGEVVDVQSHPGEARAIPPEDGLVIVNGKGERIGRRAMPVNPCERGRVRAYLDVFNAAVTFYKRNDLVGALAASDAAIDLVPTVRARFNRSLVLLSMGRWREGFADFDLRLDLVMSSLCQQAIDAGIPRWQGENITDKRLLLVHDAGFGDTVMMLRLVSRLMDLAGDVKLLAPPELNRFAGQVVPITDVADGDVWCPMLSLFRMLDTSPGSCAPYLKSPARPRDLVWMPRRPAIGIAWNIGRDNPGDFPRAIPLKLLVRALQRVHGNDVALFSVQKQDAAVAEMYGVNTVPITDFADCASLIAAMDHIVCIDTAAVHVAGAIGHPRITLLLSDWASWRWRDEAPLYPNLRVIRQTAPGDWDSALAQL
jgi:hypothetical protein